MTKIDSDTLSKQLRILKGFLINTTQMNLLKILSYILYSKNLEIIGEVAYMLTHEFREAHPHTPWKQIIGMRHCLVYGYYQISLEETWNTVQEDIPILKRQIIKYLEGI